MILTGEQIAKMTLAEIRARILQVDIEADAAKDIEDWGTALAYSEEMKILKAKVAECEKVELTSIDKFPAPGKLGGTVCTVPAPYVMKRDKPEIIGQTVKIDGEEMVVAGVERYLPNIPIYKGEIIGLWVKAKAEEKPAEKLPEKSEGPQIVDWVP